MARREALDLLLDPLGHLVTIIHRLQDAWPEGCCTGKQREQWSVPTFTRD